MPPALCDEAAEELSDEESVDSCVELTESGSIEVSASQSRDQVAVCISPRTNEGETTRTDEDNVKRVTASEIPPMSQVMLNH